MIELRDDGLRFSFPEVHPGANLSINFQRTLRIPDDENDYPLPPGLGSFPLRHVDDFASHAPSPWLEHGGVMLPMYQSEALWISFGPDWVDRHDVPYPFSVKIAAGKVCAVTGISWANEIHRDPQDYLVLPAQPWLDGYCVEKGIIRQFVAMPLGSGYSAEEQLTGEAAHGGIQIIVRPMRREVFERRFPRHEARRRMGSMDDFCEAMPCCASASGADMGLAPGGRMRQEIEEDPYDFEDWDREQRSRTFVHIANSMVWGEITGESPPTAPPTAKEYTRAGLPWFEWYDDRTAALDARDRLKKLRSVAEIAKEKGDAPLPGNETITPERIVALRRGLTRDQVRDGKF
jgi:hypothetical protein